MPNGVCLIADNGLFPFMAPLMAERFGRVLYYTSVHTEAFPIARKALWGEGLPGVERVNDFDAYVDEADLICFFDIGSGEKAAQLRDAGHAVWGPGRAEKLERDRLALKEWQKGAGLPTPTYWALHGMDALWQHFQDAANVNQYVKLSEYRGTLETFRYRDPQLSHRRMVRLETDLGEMRDLVDFIVEAPIPDALEVGTDGFTVDGQYPSTTCLGWEHKDTSYLGAVMPMADLPPALKAVTDALAPIFRTLGARTAFSTEVRVVKDGTGYLIDLATRNGSPPSEALSVLYANWPDIIVAGAAGQVVEPVPVAPYCAQIVLRSAWAADDFLALRFPEAHRPYIKLHGHSIRNGIDIVSALGMDIIGSVVGIGDTPEDAADMALEIAASIEGDELEYDQHGFEPLWDRIAEGEQRGIPWPEPDPRKAEKEVA